MLNKIFRFTLLVAIASLSLGSLVTGYNLQRKPSSAGKSVQVLSFSVKEPLSMRPAFTSNADWLKDFSLEVENTSGRPIYFVEYALVLAPVKPETAPAFIRLFYGRKELLGATQPAEPTDEPILPGETISLKIPPAVYNNLLRYLEQNAYPLAAVKEVQVVIQSINFGDGTGWQGGKLRSREMDKKIEKEQKGLVQAGIPQYECRTVERLSFISPACLLCDAPSTRNIGPGNEAVVPGRVVCASEDGQQFVCRAPLILPCL